MSMWGNEGKGKLLDVLVKHFNLNAICQAGQLREVSNKAHNTELRLFLELELGLVKVGTKGVDEFGDYEEWFNYQVSRAAPKSCAEFLISFIAEQTCDELTKGGKWLEWKFELKTIRAMEIININKSTATELGG